MDPASTSPPYPGWTAFEPELIPPPALMGMEGIHTLEEWFRWAEEWSMLLRVYGGITHRSAVLEIGCGLGRIAFPLRYILRQGTYDGFDLSPEKIAFLDASFRPAHPNFRFAWANIRNTFYNPGGKVEASAFRFPYADRSFDLVFAASVFTHMVPENTAHYLAEAARVLRPTGRCVFSFFLLDFYRPRAPRPPGFDRRDFDFDYPYQSHGDEFAIARPENPEQMTAYRLALLERLAAGADLRVAAPPVPGLWSGSHDRWIGAQDLIVLERR